MASRGLVARVGLGTLGSAPLKALDPSAGVDQLLLAGVEGMAGRAELDMQIGLGRPRVELVAAGTMNVRERVFGMDICLHRTHSREPVKSLESVVGPRCRPVGTDPAFRTR